MNNDPALPSNPALASSVFHRLMCLSGSVMKRPKPFIKRYNAVSIIHLKIFMVQIMRIIGSIDRRAIARCHPVKSGMTLCWCQAKPGQKIDYMDGVCR